MTPATVTAMNNAIETIPHPDRSDLVAAVYVDEYPENPRESGDTHIAVISCRNDHRHYTFGDVDEQFDIEAIVETYALRRAEAVEAGETVGEPHRSWAPIVKEWLIAERGAIESSMVGLALTDHSGQTLHVDVADGSKGIGGQFYMGMDTAFIGWAYATAETQATCGTPDEHLRECVIAEANEYGAYIGGDVYVVAAVEVDEDGDEVDQLGCVYGGYYGIESAREGAREVLAEGLAELTEREASATPVVIENVFVSNHRTDPVLMLGAVSPDGTVHLVVPDGEGAYEALVALLGSRGNFHIITETQEV